MIKIDKTKSITIYARYGSNFARFYLRSLILKKNGFKYNIYAYFNPEFFLEAEDLFRSNCRL